MQQLWLVSVPNRGENAETTMSALQMNVAKGSNCRIHRFEIPSLVVGTLDSLISLSDELTKISTQVEVKQNILLIFYVVIQINISLFNVFY